MGALAYAAPEAEPLLAEGRLDRVEIGMLGEALDRGDVGAIRLDREHHAGTGCHTVDVERAGVANALFAADTSAGQRAERQGLGDDRGITLPAA